MNIWIVVLILVALLLASGVACAMVYIIGVTKGFGDCYQIMKEEEKEQSYGKDKNNKTDCQQASR